MSIRAFFGRRKDSLPKPAHSSGIGTNAQTAPDEAGKTSRNSIVLSVSGGLPDENARTHFGGRPDVPPDFSWPVTPAEARGTGADAGGRRYLTFLAQFDCAALAAYDTERLLPEHGILSFFYDTVGQPWGFDPEDRQSAKAFWFPDTASLQTASFPPALPEDCRLPARGIACASAPSYAPDVQDVADVADAADVTDAPSRSKLLGFADPLQDGMELECELVDRGIPAGGDPKKIPWEVLRAAEACASKRWKLLFQLDSIETGGFSLMFGDCGRIYYFIPGEDLTARRFDRTMLILQCG